QKARRPTNSRAETEQIWKRKFPRLPMRTANVGPVRGRTRAVASGPGLPPVRECAAVGSFARSGRCADLIGQRSCPEEAEPVGPGNAGERDGYGRDQGGGARGKFTPESASRLGSVLGLDVSIAALVAMRSSLQESASPRST